MKLWKGSINVCVCVRIAFLRWWFGIHNDFIHAMSYPIIYYEDLFNYCSVVCVLGLEKEGELLLKLIYPVVFCHDFWSVWQANDYDP